MEAVDSWTDEPPGDDPSPAPGAGTPPKDKAPGSSVGTCKHPDDHVPWSSEGTGDDPPHPRPPARVALPSLGGRAGAVPGSETAGSPPWRDRLAVYLIYDLGLAGDIDPESFLEPVLAAGVGAVQLRAKDAPDRLVYRLAVELRRITRRHGALLVINDRLDLALAAGADGVHLGQDDLPVQEVRRLWPEGLVGVSARTPEQAQAAEAAGADYLGTGALRSTSTKTDSRVIGLQGVQAVVGATRLPVVAIGGVTPADIPALRRLGVAGVAVASAIMRAQRPVEAAAHFVAAWRRAPAPPSCSP